MNIRDVLNPDLGVRGMSSEWWEEQVLMLLIMNRGVLVAALRHVPPARDCYQIGLGHGQCVEVSGKQNPIPIVMKAMRKRMAIINGCGIYIGLWPGPKWTKLFSILGIKKIYYANGDPSDNEIKELKECDVEVTRVKI